MGTPNYLSPNKFKKASLLVRALLEEEDRLTSHDFLNLKKINRHINNLGCITPRQFRSLIHYSKVYKIDILQSIDFILD